MPMAAARITNIVMTRSGFSWTQSKEITKALVRVDGAFIHAAIGSQDVGEAVAIQIFHKHLPRSRCATQADVGGEVIGIEHRRLVAVLAAQTAVDKHGDVARSQSLNSAAVHVGGDEVGPRVA